MPFIRLQENLPLVYEENSRDFQLLGRLYDCVINGVKNDIDNLIYINNPDYCYSNILELLKTKVGFFTSKHFSDRELRHTLKVFSILLKNKGAKEAIEKVIYLWLRINNIKGNGYASIDNKKYVISINLPSSPKDISLLDEIFRYILPTGYIVNYVFYTKPSIDDINIKYADSSKFTTSIYDSIVRNGDISTKTIEEEKALENRLTGITHLGIIKND